MVKIGMGILQLMTSHFLTKPARNMVCQIIIFFFFTYNIFSLFFYTVRLSFDSVSLSITISDYVPLSECQVKVKSTLGLSKSLIKIEKSFVKT